VKSRRWLVIILESFFPSFKADRVLENQRVYGPWNHLSLQLEFRAFSWTVATQLPYVLANRQAAKRTTVFYITTCTISPYTAYTRGSFVCSFRSLRLVTICGDACPLSCVSAEACLTGWPNARVLLDCFLLIQLNHKRTLSTRYKARNHPWKLSYRSF